MTLGNTKVERPPTSFTLRGAGTSPSLRPPFLFQVRPLWGGLVFSSAYEFRKTGHGSLRSRPGCGIIGQHPHQTARYGSGSVAMHISKFRPLPFLHKLVTPGPPQRHQFVKRRTKTHVRRQGKPDGASDPEPPADADGVLSVGRNRTTTFYRHFSIPTPQHHNRHEPPSNRATAGSEPCECGRMLRAAPNTPPRPGKSLQCKPEALPDRQPVLRFRKVMAWRVVGLHNAR